jgi:hypothetical protein
VRRASAEFGPAPAAVHAGLLRQYSDDQILLLWSPEMVAALRDRPMMGQQQ